MQNPSRASKGVGVLSPITINIKGKKNAGGGRDGVNEPL